MVAIDRRRSGIDDTYEVTDDQLAGFGRNGLILLRGVIGSEDLRPYRDAILTVVMRHNEETRPLDERDTYGRAFLQVKNLWRLDETVACFVTARRFAAIAGRLLGVERVRLYHDQALFKEVGGGPTPWHQDGVYWPLDTTDTVTMWMPLVDVTSDMGGMAFASGSHQAPELAPYGISDEADTYFGRLVAEGGFPVSGPHAMAAGDATFHRGWALHRALPNEASTMREVMTVI